MSRHASSRDRLGRGRTMVAADAETGEFLSQKVKDELNTTIAEVAA